MDRNKMLGWRNFKMLAGCLAAASFVTILALKFGLSDSNSQPSFSMHNENIVSPIDKPEVRKFDSSKRQYESDSPSLGVNQLSKIVPKPSGDKGSQTRVNFAEKLVHLDLKGAPPKVGYLLKLFPLIKKAGATGLLMEYEDTFPYEDDLAILKNGYAYSKVELRTILDGAKRHGLRVVPLIQTFGHMEWVLKHKEFSEMREIFRYPQVTCPSNERNLPIIEKILSQVIKFHPNLDTLHIGADEAYYVGKECERCKKAVKDIGLHKLMLNHVSAVANLVKNKLKVPRVLMWNDMFKDTEADVLKEYKMGELVEPVIWKYWENLFVDEAFPPDMFQRFQKVFPKVWAGSAFKGANGPVQTFTNITLYMNNHLSWLELERQKESEGTKFQGIVLTGWQRFDHFGGLCELLPSSVPSLVTDLLLIGDGKLEKNLKERVETMLACPPYNKSGLAANNFSDVGVFWQNCAFPGSEIWDLLNELELPRKAYDKQKNSDEMNGWLAPYNFNHKYGSVFFAEKTFNRSQAMITNMTRIGTQLRKPLEDIFAKDTVNEWLFANIQYYLEDLKALSRSTLEIAHTIYFRNRPLDSDKLEI